MEESREVWIVGVFMGIGDPSVGIRAMTWDLRGAFETEANAVATTNRGCFVTRVPLSRNCREWDKMEEPVASLPLSFPKGW
jgi:hypothetical protein